MVVLMAEFFHGRVKQTKLICLHGPDLASAGVSCVKKPGQAAYI